MTEQDPVRARLKRRLAELVDNTHEIEEELRSPHSADWDEKATESEGEEVLEGMGNQALGEISEIKAALQRLDIGTYGTCTHCGKAIDDRRLALVPAAAHCIECATLADS
ncbi:MAG: TraR/DksA family transcriptional regulator [Rhodospirillales bacterium]|nr:TraR/DksA family transcriptional regulator [Rhodospirillales bacterium]